MWQQDKRTGDYKIILNCVRKLMKNKKNEKKRVGKAQTFKSSNFDRTNPLKLFN
jgi:hypothetical protein